MKPTLLLSCALTLLACHNDAGHTDSTTDSATQATQNAATSMLKEETVSYSGDNTNMKGFVVYDQNKKAKRPGILVVHEWWGLNEYPKMRARKLAELGYVAMAADMYGDGKVLDNPADAGKTATPFYQHPDMTKARFDAALAKLKSFPEVDTNNIAAVGYCFGGGVVINMAKLGEDLKGVVSFHGSLVGVPVQKDKIRAKILVCHGAADELVKPEEVATFKKQMDSAGVAYTFRQYPNAGHAFTNPSATGLGEKFKMPIRYNGAADTASWNEMKSFFATIFR
ncbi:MAG TPA: dienelactone hydrolase family protein [Chitinophagaceae bacterium]